MSEAVEEHERAERAAEGGRRWTALLIAVLAAGLAFTEQGARHAETRMADASIAAADTWAEYQAKSTRANEAKDFSAIAAALPTANPADAQHLADRFRADVSHFESDLQSGKGAVAARAHRFEETRDAARERLEGLDDASGALQLGIVLVTASVITGSLLLAGLGALLGLVGGAVAILAVSAPGLLPV